MAVSYRIARLEIAEACAMPVRPGTEGDCRPCEPDDRTELCATEAWWLLGDLALCDQHLRYALAAAGDDYEAMLARYRRRFPNVALEIPASERLPWSQRPRRLDRVRRLGTGGGARWRRNPDGPAAARAMRQRASR